MLLFEKDYYDYKTAPVVGKQVVDLNTTGVSYYNDFLSKNPSTINYLKNEKNLEGNVVMMSPEEYYKECSQHGFYGRHPSVEKLKLERYHDTNTLNHLKDVLTDYKHRFPMPYINKAENTQEGLHRMMVIGDLFGWDHKVPVLVVDWSDKQRAKYAAIQKRQQRILSNIRKAVKEALRYSFTNIEELREQIQWELDKQFDYNDDNIDTPVEFELTSDEDTFKIILDDVEYSFDFEDVNFVDNTEDEFSIDDLDIELEETEDFLKRYFGDDWKTTHPYLKDIYKLKESLQESDIEEMDAFIQANFAKSYPGDGCIFIAPNGKFINIYPTLDDHEDLCYWLEENGFEDTPEEAEWFVEKFDYVRCRNSLHLCFIDLPKKISSKQLYSLEEWLETRVSSGSLQVAVPDGKWKKYNLDEYFPKDIIRSIKRYYSSGTLYE